VEKLSLLPQNKKHVFPRPWHISVKVV